VNADQSGAGTGNQPVRRVRDPNRRVIDCSCVVHGGARGFMPLVCTKRDGDIELDPHAIGCVILLDERAACALFDLLAEWLG
jgi:hypothetical protein